MGKLAVQRSDGTVCSREAIAELLESQYLSHSCSFGYQRQFMENLCWNVTMEKNTTQTGLQLAWDILTGAQFDIDQLKIIVNKVRARVSFRNVL